ncbi:hypothetical protein LX32DRAFT_84836 [Colletotrichum zoysiae]|uniref:Uncharacterized protein n=1 Tax=Colletotrichum zoysiae TaxID=1216348 RepID=A0AAD9LXH4_9PEZI|nr:hypothetical protein LX32DRAFT_84836 [Colletotrichum zoysiae]
MRLRGRLDGMKDGRKRDCWDKKIDGRGQNSRLHVDSEKAQVEAERTAGRDRQEEHLAMAPSSCLIMSGAYKQRRRRHEEGAKRKTRSGRRASKPQKMSPDKMFLMTTSISLGIRHDSSNQVRQFYLPQHVVNSCLGSARESARRKGREH